jgi:hypothetical protein
MNMARHKNTEDKQVLAEEGQEAIIVGDVYKEENGTLEVIPFFVDFGAAQVRFSPVGRASEDLMRTSDFLGRFEHVGPVTSSSLAEKQVERPAQKEDTERA